MIWNDVTFQIRSFSPAYHFTRSHRWTCFAAPVAPHRSWRGAEMQNWHNWQHLKSRKSGNFSQLGESLNNSKNFTTIYELKRFKRQTHEIGWIPRGGCTWRLLSWDDPCWCESSFGSSGENVCLPLIGWLETNLCTFLFIFINFEELRCRKPGVSKTWALLNH